MGSTHVAREQGSCSHGCACSGPESGVQNIRGTITTLRSLKNTLWHVRVHITTDIIPSRWWLVAMIAVVKILLAYPYHINLKFPIQT
jgi:hypothetical protein